MIISGNCLLWRKQYLLYCNFYYIFIYKEVHSNSNNTEIYSKKKKNENSIANKLNKRQTTTKMDKLLLTSKEKL